MFLKPRMLKSIRGESTYKRVLEAADVGINKGESTYKRYLEAADVGTDKGGVNL